MDRESSDEEDDRHNLIHNNHSISHSSTFQIDDQFNPKSTMSPRLNHSSRFNFNKRYFFAILLFPVVILILYFSTNFFASRVRNQNSIDHITNRMRESELHALFLLKQQQLSLISLSNRTEYSGFSSAVLNQISLNMEIQQALLSTHRSGNLSGLDNDNVDSNACRNVNGDFSGRRTVEWNPKSEKYLFAICVSGQMSNHLICLEKHMFFAALLNRVLVIPSSKVDYQFNRVIDIDNVNTCLGRKVVITYEEFSKLKKDSMRIDRVICYVSSPQPCYLDDEHVQKLKSQLGISIGKLEPAWEEDIKKPNKRTAQDVVAKFTFEDDVIAIGDVFYADLEQEWVMQPGGPIAHKCKTLIEPNRLIVVTAQRFIQTFLGKNFVALHFRRHGFLKFCNAKEQSCFFPIPQAAECISRMVERVNAPVVYLSTDAAESETSLLQALIVVNGKTIPLVKRPSRNLAEKWDALLYRHGIDEDNQVTAMLDKTICAMSSVFLGAPGSTFTEDILRLRKDWRSASLCDEYLCQGELPNFIAENE